ncbi:hypothetical protein F5Y12DRAFT_718569 [Xylaria sp. FL1777]|nr:hypothetical protein F5Y12DRAFT_718569 [Xylaria sp. FL1777]
MYSRDEVCSAILKFYRHMIRHPYLEDDSLIIPPPQGWSFINNAAGKDATVVDLLHHLPYLRPTNPSSGHLLIYPGTVPFCYHDGEGWYSEELYPLPAHCVYLARRADYLGTDLILDTSNGAVTKFSMGNTSVPYDEYEALPEAEKWRAHSTVPLAELLDEWTRMYKELDWMSTPNPIGQPETGRFYKRPDLTELDHIDFEGGSELDREQRKEIVRESEHAAKISSVYIRHGWPDHFDKERCRVELLELEREKWAEDKRLMAEGNPDAALFD